MTNSISDDDLILFYYRDGLPASRLFEIEAALATVPALRARYRVLQQLLDTVDKEQLPEAEVSYEDHIWQRLQHRLGGARVGATDFSRSQRTSRRRWQWTSAGAAAAVAAIAVGLMLQRLPPMDLPAPMAQQAEPTLPVTMKASIGAGARVRMVDDSVASHLRRTEAMLLDVVNGGTVDLISGEGGQAQLLLDDNRLFAAAASRSGNRALAGFLRTLDPVLIELANQAPGSGIQLQQEDVRELVRNADLLFQVRAVEAGLRAPGPHRVGSRGEA